MVGNWRHCKHGSFQGFTCGNCRDAKLSKARERVIRAAKVMRPKIYHGWNGYKNFCNSVDSLLKLEGKK